MEHVSRRDAIKSTGLLAAAAAMGTWSSPARARPVRTRSVRVAHLTDLHIQPERRADSGVAACLRHVQEHKDAPELLLLGGDLIMDAFEADDARTRTQWDLFTRTFENECRIRTEPCLGNHDIWGINKSKSRTTGNEPGWGKKRAMDLLRMERPYRSFDFGGWHFVVLDSVTPQGNAYIGKLDNEQWEWLEGDLAGTRLPVAVLSHIPILAATQLVIQPNKDSKKREISDSLMMTDAPRFVETFAKHPHVKLCLSGHIHQIDRVEFQGVTYLCNGAVSGNWWKGRYKMCDEGYAMLDLHADGTFESSYVKYGWKAEE
ncbi:MAG: metallophosphoesterase [Phycisphaeraceae bacterium]|nr:metallophosphoesterase [Phycisphaeraceae bacterium]